MKDMKTIFLNKIKTWIAVAILITTFSCKDFLTKPPLTDFTDDNFWTAEANVRTFAWGLYNTYYGYGRGGGQFGEFYWQQEGNQSYEMKYTEDLLNSTFLGFPGGATTSNSMWQRYYTDIRKANLMLARIPDVEMSEEAKNHWTGVAKFFRANSYFALLSSWGGVPLILEYNSPDDLDNIYLPRSSRQDVANQIIKDLEDAAGLLRSNDGECAVNQYCAYALLARVALFEGTFVKYHNSSSDANAYLKIAEEAAGAVIHSGKYALVSNGYKDKYNSDNLAGNSEMILYKHYEKNVMTHTVQAYTHCSAPALHGPTKYAVESFVCTDGLPIGQSPLYQGDKGIENVRAHRDGRLQDIMFDQLGYYGVPYQDLLVSSTGYVTSIFDNPAKNIKDPDVTMDARNYIDAPIYTLSEMYLIYAEAKAEMNTLTQTDMDATINLLRSRAGVAPLELRGSEIAASGIVIDDPTRTSALETITQGGIVNPVVWEIRRERRAELIGWVHLRHMDLDRWAKGEYMSTTLNPDVMLGAWIGSVPEGSTIKINPDGYINFFPGNSRTFEDKYYLDPIPLDEIILYENKGKELAQNPGW